MKDYIMDFAVNDESQVEPVVSFVDSSLGLLMPYFSSKGIDNKITEFSGQPSWVNEIGDDYHDVVKYGHNGIVAEKHLQGGGRLLGCRLMPEDANYATVVVSVAIRDKADVVLYQRDPLTNAFLLDTDGSKIPVVGDPVAGKEMKLIISVGDVDGSNDALTSEAAEGGDTNTNAWSVHPLYYFKCKGRGKYGNNFGLSITRDPSRDGLLADGRRYVMRWYEKLKSGSVKEITSDEIMFSTNHDALWDPNSTVSEDIAQVFPFDELPVEAEFYPENYTALITALDPYFDESIVTIDIFEGVDDNGVEYDKIVMSPDTVDIADSVKFLLSGSDGSLGLGETVKDADDQDVVVDAAHIAATQKDLLKSFYLGDIDVDLLDMRLVDAGIALDALMPIDVKKVMFGLTELRPDIGVVADCGLCKTVSQAMTVAKDLAGSVPGTVSHMCSITIHSGVTTDRGKNIRTSGCYEIAYGLTSLYQQSGNYSLYAGYFNGLWKVVKPDFVPKITKGDTELGPLKNAGLLFARILDKKGRTCWMSDDNKYISTYSKLKSFRNGLVVGDAMRTADAILIKHAFTDEKAADSMRDALTELSDVFTENKYPTSISVEPSIYQTKRDIAEDTASVDLIIYFPNIPQGFKVTIRARRES